MKYHNTTSSNKKTSFKAFHIALFLGLFVLIWCVGNITIFFFFAEDGKISDSQLQSYSQSSISNLFRKIKHVYRQYSRQSERRFEFYNVSTNEIYILLDWATESRLFNIDNYKALESILSIYPNAKLRIAVTSESDGCSAPDALHGNQFLKYRKLGYNVKVIRDGGSFSILRTAGANYTRFFNSSMKSSNGQQQRLDTIVLPYHLLTYFRLLKLYAHGGIYSDFSFFFIGPLFLAGDNHEVTKRIFVNIWAIKFTNLGIFH